MSVVCNVCKKPYRHEAPMLVWGDNAEGKRTMVAPPPDADWMPDCKCQMTPEVLDA